MSSKGCRCGLATNRPML